ncbi:hypothetical protein [Agromyces archimandritae]|uniref:Uncharacterized protein n=1 Tax=Agromyces archimandritae TaxID=2781962 RepID=A0A975FJY0_9MICO|nr:hypothetical protein [Agromyces archimandritae]QTX03429.1 hypothetical protein G127AT_08605 [Agromyces archimandritae]
MEMTPDEARRALADTEAAQRTVAVEVGAPAAYWWGLGIAWVALGAIADLGNAWLTVILTFAIGLAHAIVGGRLMGGRHRSGRVQPSAATAGRDTGLVVWIFLVVLVLVTVGLALLLNADGAGHPALFASLAPATLLVAGGPRIAMWASQRAARRAAA